MVVVDDVGQWLWSTTWLMVVVDDVVKCLPVVATFASSCVDDTPFVRQMFA